MHATEVVLLMLLAVAASGYLLRLARLPIPLPLMQIALGALISTTTGEGIPLDPELFFLLFLPPLLFLDGWRIPKDDLFRDKGLFLALAFGLVFLTVLGVGLLINALIPAMPMPVAFALAAILSPTDAVALAGVTARSPVPRRLKHILEGESLLNDASGLVCFKFAVAAMLTGGFSLASASTTFLWLAVGGLATGVLVTWAITFVVLALSRMSGEDSGAPILVSLLMPFGAYLAAEQLGASGILAAVAAGITMSYVELSGRALATTRLTRTAVWDMVQYTLNGMVFVLLGEQLPTILQSSARTAAASGHHSAAWLVLYAVVIILALGALRFLWVWLGLRALRWIAVRRGHEMVGMEWRLVAVLSLAGVRGAVTLAGVLSLPLTLPGGADFPARDLAIFLAMMVILCSLLFATIGLPRLLRGLDAPGDPLASQQVDLARQLAARAAIEAVQALQARQTLAAVQGELASPATTDVEDAGLFTDAAARVIDDYQRRLGRSDPGPGSVAAEALQRADRIEKELRLAGLQAERRTVFALARQGRISDETSRRLVHDIDLLESRFSG